MLLRVVIFRIFVDLVAVDDCVMFPSAFRAASFSNTLQCTVP